MKRLLLITSLLVSANQSLCVGDREQSANGLKECLYKGVQYGVIAFVAGEVAYLLRKGVGQLLHPEAAAHERVQQEQDKLALEHNKLTLEQRRRQLMKGLHEDAKQTHESMTTACKEHGPDSEQCTMMREQWELARASLKAAQNNLTQQRQRESGGRQSSGGITISEELLRRAQRPVAA